MSLRVRLRTNQKNKSWTRQMMKDFSYVTQPAKIKIGWYKNQYEPPKYQERTADVAYRNEVGFWIHHKNGNSTYVPPRPFLQASCYWFKDDWFNKWRDIYRDLFLDWKQNKGVPDMMPLYKKFCAYVVECIQNFIYTNDWIRANKPSTIAKKKALGQPLIPLLATQTMAKSMHYEITLKDYRSKNGVRKFTE